jgi:large subunit ribosomal protein L32
MAEPKKKLSKVRTHQRRAQYKVENTPFVLCPNCKEAILPHRVCPKCGFYKGKSIKKIAPTQEIVADEHSDDKK